MDYRITVLSIMYCIFSVQAVQAADSKRMRGAWSPVTSDERIISNGDSVKKIIRQRGCGKIEYHVTSRGVSKVATYFYAGRLRGQYALRCHSGNVLTDKIINRHYSTLSNDPGMAKQAFYYYRNLFLSRSRIGDFV